MVFIDSTFILRCKSKKIRFKLCKISKINKNLNSYLCAMWYSATYRHSVIKSIILIQMSYFKRHAKILLWDIFSGFNDLNFKKLVVHQRSSIYVFLKKKLSQIFGCMIDAIKLDVVIQCFIFAEENYLEIEVNFLVLR